MKKSFLVFTSGWPGLGLVLLRCSVAGFLIATPSRVPGYSPVATCALVVLAILVGAGFRARMAALLAFAIATSLRVDASAVGPMSAATHALDALALALTGPGAFSIDARLFGRRTVRLPN